MFWAKNKLNSDEYEKLSKKIVDLYTIIEELSSKIRIVQSDNANLRGQFNRKLLGMKKEDAVEEQKTETESINNQVILPYDGNIFKSYR